MDRARGCFSPPSRRHVSSAAAAAARRCSFPIPSTPPMPRARWRRIASRSICPPPRPPAFFPISTRSPKNCSRAPSLSSSPRLPIRRARLPTSLISRAWSRSNLPGLRIGFAAGDRQFLARFLELRNVSAPQVPVPAQRVAIAAYGDEAHVEKNRRLYGQKYDLADQIIGARYGYRRPAGGFFLWLDVSPHGGDEAVALKLWREAGLRVVPGRYLAREQVDGSNPGLGY